MRLCDRDDVFIHFGWPHFSAITTVNFSGVNVIALDENIGHLCNDSDVHLYSLAHVQYPCTKMLPKFVTLVSICTLIEVEYC